MVMLTAVHNLALLPRHVVEDDYLNVFARFDVMSLRVVTRFPFGVDVDHLPVPLVLEKKTLLMIRNDLKVRALVRGGVVGIPIEERKICWPGQQSLFALEVWLEILDLQAMPIIDVSRYLLSLIHI